MVYFPIAQWNEPAYTLAARVTGDARIQATALERALKSAEPALVIESAGAMSSYVRQATARERLVTYLVTAMGALALLLACVGLYGVLSPSPGGRQSLAFVSPLAPHPATSERSSCVTPSR
jgi:hypothetical protein